MRVKARQFGSIRRPGVALVETISLISVVAAILSLAAMIINQAYTAHRDALQVIQNSEQMQRLSDRIKDDVRVARELHVEDNASQLVLDMADGKRVHYFQLANQLVREERLQDQLAGRDDWNLPAEVTISWSVDHSHGRALLTTQIDFPAGHAWPDQQWLVAVPGKVPAW